MILDTVTLNFKANKQMLIGAYPFKMASHTVRYIVARFSLGEGWNPEDYDAIAAAWKTDFSKIITLLDVNGTCVVPWEVLTKKSRVKVNLVGYKSINGELYERMTTYPLEAIRVDAMAIIEGSETQPVTPSQFEQYIAEVGTYARTANTNALKSEGYAVGEQNGVVVEDGDYYHNNAKYYSEQANSSAVSASADAGTATQKADEASDSADLASRKASEASASAQSAQESVEAGGYVNCYAEDEHLIITLHNLSTISFRNNNERLEVVYG